MVASRIILEQLVFTGAGLEDAQLAFDEGLNIVYGASNTGKSFVLRALNFMLGGGDPLPNIEQRQGYDKVWLSLSLPDRRQVTLYRAARGGAFMLYDGVVTAQPGGLGLTLAAKHAAGNSSTLSSYLLRELGVHDKEIVKNSSGQKESITFRSFARYLFADENAIFSERSPALSGQFTKDTVEKNILRFILTGRDDSAVVASRNRVVQTAVIRGKTDLVDELISAIDGDLSQAPSRDETVQQLAQLNESIAALHALLASRQQALDELVQQRRHAADRLAETMARSSELGAILARFAKLEEVYRSDAERLHGLEEASFLLKVKAGRPCPLCGAAPEHGRHQHDASDVERARYAALAEIERVEAERADLQRTMVSLHAEGEGLRGLMDELQRQVHRLDSDIEAARPKEARSRAEHEDLLKKRATLQQYEDLFRQREHLQERRTRLAVPVPRPAVGKELPVGVDGATGHAFATIVQNILADWHFPGTPIVSFDTKSHDILLNGKGRDANGKGVRALLHAAFKIGVLVFCRSKGLPHPGFVVLDTPLLTYREPLKTPKHGELSADEEEVKRTSLNEHFYRYLVGLREHAQILVLENTDPPGLVAADAAITPFTGQLGDGRFGYFPIRPPRPSTKSKRKQPAGGVAVANTTTRLG